MLLLAVGHGASPPSPFPLLTEYGLLLRLRLLRVLVLVRMLVLVVLLLPLGKHGWAVLPGVKQAVPGLLLLLLLLLAVHRVILIT